MKIGRETNAGKNIPPKPSYNTPSKNKGIELKVKIDTSEIDVAIEKVGQLKYMLEKIDGLTGRIKRDLSDINRYGNGGRFTSSGDNPRGPRD